MADPSKKVELQKDWAAAGVGIEIPKVDPKTAKNLKKRLKGSTKPSASGPHGTPRASRQEVSEGKRVAESSALNNADASSLLPKGGASSPLARPEKRPRMTEDALVVAEVDPAAEERRLREELDARLRDQGFLPFVGDLEACKRVGTIGLDLFRKMTEGVPSQMAQVLRGKITSCISENYHFADQLAKVQAELDSQRDKRYLDLSSENRELREKAERLQGLNKELGDARTTIANQATQLEALPGIRAERDRAKEEEKAIRKEAEALKKRVEDLSLGKAEAVKKAAEASAGGF